MSKKIVLAGGTGFVGSYFDEKFSAKGYEVIIISRQKDHLQWKDRDGVIAALEGADMLINLAGKSISDRYTEENKKIILSSRIKTTTALGEALRACNNPPPVWFNASAMSIFRAAEDHPMTESNGAPGTDFLGKVAQAWEEAMFGFDLPRTRQVALRITIVLGEGGGILKPMVNLTRMGLGGHQGSGKQMFSWIHIEDLYRIVLFLEKRPELDGGFLCGSPHPVSNKELMKSLRKALSVPIGLPAAGWMVKIGSAVMGTESELVLDSRWVLPERLLDVGFVFKFPELDGALKDVLGK